MDAVDKLARSNVDSSKSAIVGLEHCDVHDLVCRCLKGDGAAWTELFERYHAPLKDRVRMHLGQPGRDSSLVDEVVSEVWLELVQRDGKLLRHFQRGRSFLAYLSSIARYKTLLHFRARKRRREQAAGGTEYPFIDRGALDDYSEIELSEFLALLTPRERQFLDTLLLPQRAAPHINVSNANLWQLRHRVRRKLCDYLTS